MEEIRSFTKEDLLLAFNILYYTSSEHNKYYIENYLQDNKNLDITLNKYSHDKLNIPSNDFIQILKIMKIF